MYEKFLIYDIECLSNCFTITFVDFKSNKQKAFVIHELQNDIRGLMLFLRSVYQSGYVLVGYNCNAYDNQLLEYIATNYEQLSRLPGERIAAAIYEKSQWIIALPDDSKYLQLVPEWKFTIPHIDIYKQKHYDGKGKRCSLKWLEFTMRFPNIESMPIQHYDTIYTWEEIHKILAYNLNDVLATKRSFQINQFETNLRIKLSEKFDLNLINASEPKLARDIFGQRLAQSMGITFKALKEMRTYRSSIRVSDIIFDYVNFKDPTLIAVKEFFEGLEFNPYSFEQNNYKLKHVEKTFRFGNLEVVVGLGGLHACAPPGVYESNDEWTIEDIDGSSYYPNLGIKNRLYPEHLSEVFCDIYEELYIERQKIPKEDPVNYAYKIVLNSTFGLSKEMNNYFHDPKYTFAITINGQLLLLKLAELLKYNVPGIVFYQFNTDGISIGYHPKYKSKVEKCMKLWEKVTRITLEDKLYKKMVIMDVNNYMAIDLKGNAKRKGRVFAYSLDPKDKELDYHKNPSALIIPKALEAYFNYGTPVEEYIKSSTDIYDFCIGIKVKKNDFNLIHYSYNKKTNQIETKTINEQVVRFFVSKDQTTMKKQYKPGTKKAGQFVEVAAKNNCTYFNIYKEKPMAAYNINYNYYIKRAREVIDTIQPNSRNLKLF